MKTNHFLLLLMISLSIFSCHQDKEEIIVDTQVERKIHHVKYENFDGLIPIHNSAATFTVYKGHSDTEGASGSLEVDWGTLLSYGEIEIDDTTHNFVVEHDTAYYNGISYSVDPYDSTIFEFYGLFEDDTVQIQFLDSKGYRGIITKDTLLMEYSLAVADNGTQISSRGFPIIGYWIIVGGVSLITTVSTCAYERTAARQACQEQLLICNNTCPRPCDYRYISGMCGGDCSTLCPPM